ncbi:TetR/AcrR family transcriptional regulator [Nocardioides marmoriginsengisoli]|uniref:TetR/AcrR family transcriptional regulator n=1 Tax=Nocardioides marmoriginsengisoli TaxID=661483 RepID=A0A3N0CCQ2_9ACTN|nr:TetR/AcrR family transcriptional regulator [Nocardioides marmoriginsengisoli]RNL61232.1 TetR/AcrR family transcriptional regulator [Nocardioides marmoriginsengisoli]
MTSNAGTKGVARADREAQILDVACRAFGEAGYAATSVADIAEAAGISKPLIYNYFGSKEGLHAVCVQHAAETLWAEFERSSRTDTVGLARAVVTLDGMFQALAPQPWMWRLVFDPTAPSDGASHEALLDYERRLFTLGADGVGELMRLAGNTDAGDTSATHAVWESVFRSLVTWWLDHPEVSPAAMTDRCIRLFSTVFGDLDEAARAAVGR